MTTPNRPPLPDWYQQQRRTPRHIGPTQRELISRRVRSLRQFLIGASVVGVATFTTLAAYHTESKYNTAANTQTTSDVQPSVTSTGVTSNSIAAAPASTPAQSLFNENESEGFHAEGQGSDDQSASYAAVTTTPTQSTTSTSAQSAAAATTVPAPTATTAPQQSTTAQVTTQIPSRHRSRTISS